MKVATNPLADIARSAKLLLREDVLAGVPEAEAPRKQGKEPVNNAALAYIHDNGSPLAHIPPREFLRSGIVNAKDKITERFAAAGKAALEGNQALMEKQLHAAGLEAQKAIRRKIQTGPFTPLKASTIAARKRKHKNRKNTLITPLIDTGQLLASINYVVRQK